MVVGFMELGAMGRPMARNLAKAGFGDWPWNRSPIESPKGVTLVGSPRAVGELTEVA